MKDSSTSPATHWDNPPVELFHGTIAEYASSILQSGIDPSKGRINADFGQGFYTTTRRKQAVYWAILQADKRQRDPAIVKVTVKRLALRHLKSLVFVLGDTMDRISFHGLEAKILLSNPEVAIIEVQLP